MDLFSDDFQEDGNPAAEATGISRAYWMASVAAFASRLNEFLLAKHSVIEGVYAKAQKLGVENDATPAFLFQPEVLLIYNLLTSARDKTRQVWNENYPERELERIANTFGISLD